jgi:hypothetical protein
MTPTPGRRPKPPSRAKCWRSEAKPDWSGHRRRLWNCGLFPFPDLRPPFSKIEKHWKVFKKTISLFHFNREKKNWKHLKRRQGLPENWRFSKIISPHFVSSFNFLPFLLILFFCQFPKWCFSLRPNESFNPGGQKRLSKQDETGEQQRRSSRRRVEKIVDVVLFFQRPSRRFDAAEATPTGFRKLLSGTNQIVSPKKSFFDLFSFS